MEEDKRKPVVYLDLEEKAKRDAALKALSLPARPGASSLDERFAFWMDLIDR